MRVRKKHWANPLLNAHPEIVIHNPQERVGQWCSNLSLRNLHVEIGGGKGDYWIEMARKFPEDCWVTVEKDSSVAAFALRKMLESPQPNMFLINGDAKDLNLWFDHQEIDVIHLNFSDPWPKKAHHKRRLTHQSFLQNYQKLLKNDGEIQMKTDNMDLFEFSCQIFSQNNWICMDISVDYRRNSHPEDAISEYEQRFIDLKQPIYRCVWRKRNESK